MLVSIHFKEDASVIEAAKSSLSKAKVLHLNLSVAYLHAIFNHIFFKKMIQMFFIAAVVVMKNLFLL